MNNFMKWLNGESTNTQTKTMRGGQSTVNPEEKATITLDSFLREDKEIELTATNSNSSYKFFHFGDWSSHGNFKNPPIEIIVQALKKNKFDFGLICGDNFYHKDMTGGKLPEADQMIIDHDFGIMRSLKIPLFAIFGQHDIENCDVMLAEIEQTSFAYKNKNLIVDTKDSNWVIPYPYYSVIYHGFQFIMIDTNLLAPSDSLSACYNNLGYDPKDKMLAWFGKQLTDPKRNNLKSVIVSHLPLIAITGDKIHVVMDSVILLKLKESGKKHFYNLAASVHNFQRIKFVSTSTYGDIQIEIVVSGTGGGPSCKIPPEIHRIVNKDIDVVLANGDRLGVMILLEIQEPFGYTMHEISTFGNLSSKYVKLGELP